MSDRGYLRLRNLLAASLLLAVLASLLVGTETLPLRLLGKTFAKVFWESHSELGLEESIIWELRLPRILLAVLMGASLSASGVAAQGIFRNQLADPGIIGVSAGSALSAIIGIHLGIDEKNLWAIPILSALGASLTLMILFFLSRKQSHISGILLTGFALSSLFAAMISLLLSLRSDEHSFPIKTFEWLLGSFESKGWDFFYYSLPFSGAGILVCFFLVRELDLLHLGFDTARSLGSNEKFAFWGSILSIGVLVGTVTAMVGMIGFVGLMVPHISRFLVGGMHRKLLVTSMWIGGLLLLTVDTISRVMTHFYLPPGVITSLLGAPFFLWLVRNSNYGTQRGQQR